MTDRLQQKSFKHFNLGRSRNKAGGSQKNFIENPTS